MMGYALSNLIKNALYAIKVAEKGEISIKIQTGRDLNRLTVTDTASGIPKHVLPHIFDTYYSTKKHAGTGVGLAFCLRVMNAFDGQIQCESVAGEYTTFLLTLPARKPSRSDTDQAADLRTH